MSVNFVNPFEKPSAFADMKTSPEKDAAPTLYPSMAGKGVALGGTITSGVLAINALVWGIMLSSGPMEMRVNGIRTVVNESALLGPALLILGIAFIVAALMFLTVLLASSVSTKKEGTWWFLSFSVLVPCILVSFLMIGQRIGSPMAIAAFAALGLLISGLLVSYMYVIAKPFKGDGSDSSLKMLTTKSEQSSYITIQYRY